MLSLRHPAAIRRTAVAEPGRVLAMPRPLKGADGVTNERTTPMRIRITYAKRGELRYTGHLDLQRVWERTLRRSGLPIVFSQGFNPLPKLQLASRAAAGDREHLRGDGFLAGREAGP